MLELTEPVGDSISSCRRRRFSSACSGLLPVVQLIVLAEDHFYAVEVCDGTFSDPIRLCRRLQGYVGAPLHEVLVKSINVLDPDELVDV